MSRIGKKPVVIPAGVSVSVEAGTVKVKGPKGELVSSFPDSVLVSHGGAEVSVSPVDDGRVSRSAWGMARTMINNMVQGVTVGFSQTLEIIGVGYRAAVQGSGLQLNLGYSHDVVYPIPAGITITTPKPTEIVIVGIDKQQVGQVAAEIRSWRPPEPYKGKGVRRAGEFVPRKEGKKK